MNRRHFLSASASVAATGLLSQPSAQAASLSMEVAPLPYAPEALEPHIDAATMTIHHGKHHQAYATNLKAALESANLNHTDPVALIRDINALPAEIQMAVRNNGGGHVNHSWFWNWMTPAGDNQPGDKMAAAIQADFGSMDSFKTAFSDAAAKRFGSGWAWLIKKDDGKLAVVSTPNQDNPLMKGIVPDSDLGTPLLGIDVWEHAYYLNYQNRRPDYVTAWWNVVNWAAVEAAL